MKFRKKLLVLCVCGIFIILLCSYYRKKNYFKFFFVFCANILRYDEYFFLVTYGLFIKKIKQPIKFAIDERRIRELDRILLLLFVKS